MEDSNPVAQGDIGKIPIGDAALIRKAQRTCLNAAENAGKATAVIILPLTTVWFLVRFAAGPPIKSGIGEHDARIPEMG